MGEPCGNRKPASPRNAIGELEGFYGARGLDRMVDAAAGRLSDSLGHIRIGCKERVRRAQRAGKLQLVLGEIDRDDALGAGGNGTQKGCQSHPAQPDDGNGFARPNPARIDDRSDAGQHGTAEQRRLYHRQVRLDLDRGMARNHRIIGKSGDAEVMVHGDFAAMQPAFPRKQRALAVCFRSGYA